MTDYNEQYKRLRAQSGHFPRLPEEWDGRAARMGREATAENSYVRGMLERIDCRGCRSALDLGCGTGALLIPLAGRLERVYGVDFSSGMLHEAREHAARAGCRNVEWIEADWQREWARLPAADIVVASRCLDVDDMLEALRRLDALARKRVYVTYRMGRSYLDDDLLRAVGRDVAPRPGSELIGRILRFQLGIQPGEYCLETPEKSSLYPTFASFAERLRWTLGELSAREEKNAEEYYHRLPLAGEGPGRMHKHPVRWALFTWNT